MSNTVQQLPWYQQVPDVPTNGYNPNAVNGEAEGLQAEINPTKGRGDLDNVLQGTALQQSAGPTGTSDAPPLPDVVGQQSSVGTMANKGKQPSWMSDPGDRPITSLAQAFDVMIEVAAATMMQNGKLKNIFNKNQIDALKASAQAQIDQVEGERKSAATKLAGAIVATGAVIGVGYLGAAFNFGGATSRAAGIGAALGGGGMAVTQLINSATSYFDTCMPGAGQHEADEAKIRKAIQDMFVQQYKSQEDNFNNNYENSRKAVQNVLDMKRAIDDNTNQVTLNILQNA